jgi:hypothetical protein
MASKKAKWAAREIMGDGIAEILADGERRGLTKPYDLAVTILSDIYTAGMEIRWQAGKKPPREQIDGLDAWRDERTGRI